VPQITELTVELNLFLRN